MSENISSTVPVSPVPSGSDLNGSAQPAYSMAGRSDPMGTPISPSVIPPKKFTTLLLLLLPVLVIVAIISIYVLLQTRTMYKQTVPIPSPSPTASAEALAKEDPIVDWQTYNLKELGISFKYPRNLQPMDYPNGIEVSGNKGKQICLSFIPFETGLNLVKSVLAGVGACSGTFVIGSTSSDYEEGREGGFGDYHGYRRDGDKYYAIFVGGTESPIDPTDVREITNANGIKMLLITGANSLQFSERGSEPKPGNPGEGYLGALVNRSRTSYSGFNIQMKLTPTLTKELFDQILSTFKFTESDNSSYTCPENGWQNCMPILSEESQKACSDEAMDWYKSNCPDFKGAAL